MNELVIVTSAISVVDKPLSYSNVRSRFSAKERIEQTKKTIESIKQKFPNTQIFVVEQGREYVPEIASIKNVEYIFNGGNFFVRMATDSPIKGLGEAVSIIYSSRRIFSKEAKFYYKISGRYFLDEHFDVNRWDYNFFNFKIVGRDFLTVLYGVPQKYYFLWMSALIIGLPLLWANKSIEFMLGFVLPHQMVKGINVLGISGYDSCEGKFFKL